MLVLSKSFAQFRQAGLEGSTPALQDPSLVFHPHSSDLWTNPQALSGLLDLESSHWVTWAAFQVEAGLSRPG